MPKAKPSDETGMSGRRDEILAAASDLAVSQGFLPVPVEQIARAAGVSKGLVYAYFPTGADLYNTLLAERMAALAETLAPARLGLEKLAARYAQTYFEVVVAHGPVLHILFTDAYLDGRRSAAACAVRDAIWRRLVRMARRSLKIPAQDAVAALAMILAVPEDLGRLVASKDITQERARTLCAELVLSCLHGARGARAAR